MTSCESLISTLVSPGRIQVESGLAAVHCRMNLGVLRKAGQFFFAEDQVAVDDNLEDSATTLDEADFHTIFFIQVGRQTGGLWKVVSLNAVLDADIHRWLPFFPIPKSGID